MIRATVTTPARSYDVVIQHGLLQGAGSELRGILEPSRPLPALFVVTVPLVRRRWGGALMKSLATAGFKAKWIEMPDGERYKTATTVDALAEKLTKSGADRDAVIVAFGGGVVGDVAGLLASLYMRGVDLVQVPTTVLAQLDASIGGKTGVNLRAGKNLIGTFHQPLAVLIDPAVLSTLPDREFRAGLYEALKCGVIGRPELFRDLDRINLQALRGDMAYLERIIGESARLKAEVVSQDEKEGGLRRVLNFGHTIGHALEAESGYRWFLHGEAVAWGMIAAAHIAEAVKCCSAVTAGRIRKAVLGLGPLPKIEARSRDILRLLQTDKKTRHGIVHFVLPVEIGKVKVVSDVPERVVLEAINELRRASRSDSR